MPSGRFLLAIVLSLVGCSSPQWQEPVGSINSELATLSYNPTFGLTITHIDGYAVPLAYKSSYKMTNGPHIIKTKFTTELDGKQHSGEIDLSFSADSKNEYYLSHSFNWAAKTWIAQIKDLKSNKIISRPLQLNFKPVTQNPKTRPGILWKSGLGGAS